MTSMYEHAQSLLNVQFNEEPYDQYHRMIEQFDNPEQRGTAMPPSPMCKEYTIAALMFDAYRVEYELNVVWHDHATILSKMVEPWQITHRSREVALAVGPQRINELYYKLNSMYEHRQDYLDLACNEQESLEIFHLILDTTRSELRLNFETIRKYVKEHETSSTGEGRLWSEMRDLSESDWANLLDAVKYIIDEMRNNPGKYNDIRFFFGMRARSNALEAILSKYVNFTERTRKIMFYLGLSIWTIFIPNKIGWYRTIVSGVLDILDITAEVNIPFIHGGEVYTRAAELFNEGLEFKAYDGKAWDMGVGTILGPTFNPFMMIVKDVAMLPSGVTVTSLLDTIASLIAIRYAKGIFLILGDDINTWGASGVPNKWCVEFQLADTKYKYILGVSYYVHPFEPRLSGWRISMDRAGKMVKFNLDGVESEPFTYSRPPEVIAAHAQMFLGKFGDHTLYDAIKNANIATRDYFAPREYFEELAETAEAEQIREAVHDWAKGEPGMAAAIY